MVTLAASSSSSTTVASRQECCDENRPCSADLPFLGRSAAVRGFLDEKPQTTKSGGLRYIILMGCGAPRRHKLLRNLQVKC